MSHQKLLQASGFTADDLKDGSLIVDTPINGEAIANLSVHTISDVEGIITKSVQAFKSWRQVPAPRRGELVRLFGEKASNPLGYLDRCWANEEFSAGCYGAFMPPGAWTRCGRALAEPVGPIHWAGAETATRWTGYMDGAVSSGRRAAGEVLASL